MPSPEGCAVALCVLQHSDMELHDMELQVVQLKRALQSLPQQQGGEGEVRLAAAQRALYTRALLLHRESSTH